MDKPKLEGLTSKALIDFVNYTALGTTEYGASAVYVYDVFKFFNVTDPISTCNACTIAISDKVNKRNGGATLPVTFGFDDWLRLEVIDGRPYLTKSLVQDDLKKGTPIQDLSKIYIKHVLTDVEHALHYTLRYGYTEIDGVGQAFFSVGLIAYQPNKLKIVFDAREAQQKIQEAYGDQLSCMFMDKPSPSFKMTSDKGELKDFYFFGDNLILHGEK